MELLGLEFFDIVNKLLSVHHQPIGVLVVLHNALVCNSSCCCLSIVFSVRFELRFCLPAFTSASETLLGFFVYTSATAAAVTIDVWFGVIATAFDYSYVCRSWDYVSHSSLSYLFLYGVVIDTGEEC